jgi:hypothetical protein
MKSVPILLVFIITALVAYSAAACPAPPSCGVIGCPCNCGMVYEAGNKTWLADNCAPAFCATLLIGCAEGPVYMDVQTETTCEVPGTMCTYIMTCLTGSSQCLEGNCFIRSACRAPYYDAAHAVLVQRLVDVARNQTGRPTGLCSSTLVL